MNKWRDSETAEAILIIGGLIMVVVGLIWAAWWLFLRIDRVETMSVRSKEWSREIKELEDYQTWECHTRWQDVCTGFGSDRKCREESYQQCGWETHTRTINTWPTSGVYPTKPAWQADYKIGPGHYERRYENYVIHLSDDKDVWNYNVNSEAHYDTFPVRGKCLVGLNWANGILKVEC